MLQSEEFPKSNIPHGGWLHELRRTRGLSLQAVADRLNVSPQAIHQFEKSEAAGTISLRQLGNVAAAMGGRLTYAVVAPSAASPKSRRRVLKATTTPSIPSPATPPIPAEQAVELSMFLQNQADGRFD